MKNDELHRHRRHLHEKYGDVLGVDMEGVDPDLVRLVGALDAISAENEPPASVVRDIGTALGERTSRCAVQGNTRQRQQATSTMPPLLASVTQGIGRRLISLPKVAAGLLIAFILIGATYSVMSVIDQAFHLDESTKPIAEEKLGIELNQSKTIDGFTVSVKRAYADEEQIVIGYTVSGPPGRKFDTFLASGAFESPGHVAAILPTLSDTQGNKLNVIGVAAAFDTGAQGGEYGQALRYEVPSFHNNTREFRLHFEVGKITAYEQINGDKLQAITITGPFEFEFTVPIESESSTK